MKIGPGPIERLTPFRSGSASGRPSLPVNAEVCGNGRSLDCFTSSEVPTKASVGGGFNLKAALQRTTAIALMVSTVATSMPGLALAGESLGNTDLPANPVAEQMAEVSGSPDSEWYQAPLEFFSGIKSARYESKVGDYDLRVDALNTQVRVKPKVKLDEAGLKVSGRLDLANTQLTRSFESGGWNITQGGYARLRLEGEVGGSISKEAGSSEHLDHGVLLQGGLFRRWETSLSDTTTFKVQTELGLQHNFTQNDSTAFSGPARSFAESLSWPGMTLTGLCNPGSASVTPLLEKIAQWLRSRCLQELARTSPFRFLDARPTSGLRWVHGPNSTRSVLLR